MPEATQPGTVDTSSAEASAEPLLEISDEAAEKLKEQMAEHEGTQGLRLLVQGGCCGMQYAMAMAKREPEDGERVVTSNGIDVYVDEPAVEMIRGARVAWTDGIFGAGFTFENPNAEDAAGSCGCR